MFRKSINRTGFNGVEKVGVEDGVLYGLTEFYDKQSLDINQKIKNSGMLEKGALGLHDNADIRMTISCPSTLQWRYFKKDHAETYKLLMSRDEIERLRGAKQLQILEPDWVVQSRL